MAEQQPATAEENQNLYRVVWGPQRFRLSIGWKTLIAFALVVFIPMFGLLHITEQTLRETMEDETYHSLEANLRGAWRVYHERHTNLRSALVLSAAAPGAKSAFLHRSSNRLTPLLNRQAGLLPYVDVWLAFDDAQRVLARRNGETGQKVFLNNLVSQAFTFKEPVLSTELLSNELFIEENPLKYSNLATQVMAQVVVVPVEKGGEVIGALAGLILMNDDRWLPNAIHDYLSIDAALFGSVIQESRIISASSRPNNIWAEGLLAPTSLNQAINQGEPFQGRVTVNGIPSFIISEPIENNEGTPIGALSIGVRSGGIDALVQSNTRNIYLFIGVGIALSLLIALLAYRDTMVPIRAVRGAMDEFARGNLAVRTDLRTKDEFEGMGRGFNRMAQAVQEHQERVESFNSLTSLLITSLRPQALLQKVLNKVVELTTSQAGTIYLTETRDGEKVLVPYVSYAVNLDALPSLRFGEGLPGQAALERRLIHAKHVPEDCKVSINFGLADAMPKEVAIFPILYREEVLGVMLLGSVNRFDANEVSLLEYITNQIAVVLENALTHEEVERLSVTDGLTGVFNRRHITARMEEEFSKARRYANPISVLLVDIDHFKGINDEFGHHAGDEALIGVADAMEKSLRETDMLGRYGGEEFVILLPQTGAADAATTAEKLRQRIEALELPSLGGEGLTVSIGVAGHPAHPVESMEQLVQAADGALYQAKDAGRNRVQIAG
ncbi:MAG TPA: diguanylate cyclase [Gammaproteobacteria bacterium]|nr:diguanylate cyclase [Gammaproteobacteria bacterium]